MAKNKYLLNGMDGPLGTIAGCTKIHSWLLMRLLKGVKTIMRLSLPNMKGQNTDAGKGTKINHCCIARKKDIGKVEQFEKTKKKMH